MSIPNKVFIIPYRNRPKEKEMLSTFFKKLKIDRKWSDSEVDFIYINQTDKRLFNRGAMKNIGFLYIKNEFPNNYKDITLIFHDVDFYPDSTSLLPYNAKKGEVEHYYGFDFTLGGIFSINADDFEKTGGFPNYWGWGFEDNLIYERCKSKKIKVNRDNFYKIYDKHFIYLDDGDKNNSKKLVSEIEIQHYRYYKEKQTINDLINIKLIRENEFINVLSFDTGYTYNKRDLSIKNLKNGKLHSRAGYFKRNWRMLR